MASANRQKAPDWALRYLTLLTWVFAAIRDFSNCSYLAMAFDISAAIAALGIGAGLMIVDFDLAPPTLELPAAWRRMVRLGASWR